MEQEIRFCTTSDSVSIAYAIVGEGSPLVYVCGWPQHLELEWEKPFGRGFLEALGDGFEVVRYDMRGSGLSDRNVSGFSLDELVLDLEGVVDHLKLRQFALLSLGTLAGPIAIQYSATHPEQVTHLILSGAFLRGGEITTPERQKALVEYASSFGFPMFDFSDAATLSLEEQTALREIQRAASSHETQAALLRTLFSVDVSGLAERVSVPSLVMHARTDPVIPFALGREVAARIPKAKLVPFESTTTAIWEQSDVILPELRRFVGVEAAGAKSRGRADVGAVRTILFTDVEGSTALTRRLGDARARDVLREHERMVREALTAHEGAELKTIGDGFMASFSSVTRALECAIAMQRAFAEHNESAEEPIRVRIGLNAGEPIAEDDPGGRSDLFGIAVIVAARIAAKAQGGEILASEAVRQIVAGKGFFFSDRGEVELHGFDEAVRVYEVRWRKEG